MYKNTFWSRTLIVSILLLAIALLAACQAEPEEVEVIITKVVTETIVEEGETVEVTRIVEVPVTVIAEAPEPVVEEVVQGAPDTERRTTDVRQPLPQGRRYADNSLVGHLT